MSDKFSATLRLGDLNDYIAPSQGCVVSLKKDLNPTSSAQKPGKLDSSKPVQREPVKISLKDCLACSGCITSAETIMLEKQSLDEFLSNIDKAKAVIISLSPQSRASLAVHFNLSPIQVHKKLTTFFKSFGAKAVFDTSCSRDLTLIESCHEFVARYKEFRSNTDKKQNSNLPMISSACPGWICYAEKTLGSYILPYISTVKSPQQNMGAVIKNRVCESLYLRPEEIYHVTVMPCYDKKLEAVRDDFVFQVEQHDERLAEVDSVLTTGEVLDLIKLKEVDFKTLEESSLDELLTNIDEASKLFGIHGSSGGYADTVFRYAAKVLFSKEIVGPLDFKTIRNSDFKELSLEVDGETVLKFALCYGFRNLQNVVRKIKTGKCEYQFLEIMACPSGCLNGGGQIKPKPGESARDLLQLLETKYMEDVLVADPFENPIVKRLYDETCQVLVADPFENPIVKRLYDGWLDQPGSKKAQKHAHTEYHPIVKSITSQLQNW